MIPKHADHSQASRSQKKRGLEIECGTRPSSANNNQLDMGQSCSVSRPGDNKKLTKETDHNEPHCNKPDHKETHRNEIHCTESDDKGQINSQAPLGPANPRDETAIRRQRLWWLLLLKKRARTAASS
jgi:hypothetical protein